MKESSLMTLLFIAALASALIFTIQSVLIHLNSPPLHFELRILALIYAGIGILLLALCLYVIDYVNISNSLLFWELQFIIFGTSFVLVWVILRRRSRA